MGNVARVCRIKKLATLILACTSLFPAIAFEVPRLQIPTIHVPTPHITTPNVRTTLPDLSSLRGNRTNLNSSRGTSNSGGDATTIRARNRKIDVGNGGGGPTMVGRRSLGNSTPVGATTQSNTTVSKSSGGSGRDPFASGNPTGSNTSTGSSGYQNSAIFGITPSRYPGPNTQGTPNTAVVQAARAAAAAAMVAELQAIQAAMVAARNCGADAPGCPVPAMERLQQIQNGLQNIFDSKNEFNVMRSMQLQRLLAGLEPSGSRLKNTFPKIASRSPTNPILSALNPGLNAQRFAWKYPSLVRVGRLYSGVAGKLTPNENQELVRIALRLIFEERLNSSVSSLQLSSRIKGALSAANGISTVSGYGAAYGASNGTKNGAPNSQPGTLGGAAEAAVLVIMMMVQDGDQDLQAKMLEAEAQMAAKQALRALIDNLNAFAANVAGVAVPAYCPIPGGCNCPPGTEYGTSGCPAGAIYFRGWPTVLPTDTVATGEVPISTSPSARWVICPANNPGCQVPPAQLQQAQAAGCPPGTAGTLACELLVIAVQIQNALESDIQISEMASMQLQMLMDARSKLLQTASDIEKSNSDAGNSISKNIKQ
jgi:hypothetical protein